MLKLCFPIKLILERVKNLPLTFMEVLINTEIANKYMQMFSITVVISEINVEWDTISQTRMVKIKSTLTLPDVGKDENKLNICIFLEGT